jgi:hypothetical protein
MMGTTGRRRETADYRFSPIFPWNWHTSSFFTPVTLRVAVPPTPLDLIAVRSGAGDEGSRVARRV